MTLLLLGPQDRTGRYARHDTGVVEEQAPR